LALVKKSPRPNGFYLVGNICWLQLDVINLAMFHINKLYKVKVFKKFD
jgi:hypothetical protein